MFTPTPVAIHLENVPPVRNVLELPTFQPIWLLWKQKFLTPAGYGTTISRASILSLYRLTLHISVHIVTKLTARRDAGKGQVIYLFSRASISPPGVLFSGYRKLFPLVPSGRACIWPLIPSSVEIKNRWSFTTTPYAFTMFTGPALPF